MQPGYGYQNVQPMQPAAPAASQYYNPASSASMYQGGYEPPQQAQPSMMMPGPPSNNPVSCHLHYYFVIETFSIYLCELWLIQRPCRDLMNKKCLVVSK